MLSNNSLSQEEEELSQKAIQHLRSTSRWVRFFGILGFIISFLSIFSFFGAVTGALDAIENGVSIIWPLLGLSIVAATIGISFYLSFTLFSYGSSTKNFTETTDYEQLGIAFKRQLIYWRWMGISVSILLGFYVVYFVFLILLSMNQGI
jgi:hypothetical protein